MDQPECLHGRPEPDGPLPPDSGPISTILSCRHRHLAWLVVLGDLHRTLRQVIVVDADAMASVPHKLAAARDPTAPAFLSLVNGIKFASGHLRAPRGSGIVTGLVAGHSQARRPSSRGGHSLAGQATRRRAQGIVDADPRRRRFRPGESGHHSAHRCLDDWIMSAAIIAFHLGAPGRSFSTRRRFPRCFSPPANCQESWQSRLNTGRRPKMEGGTNGRCQHR